MLVLLVVVIVLILFLLKDLKILHSICSSTTNRQQKMIYIQRYVHTNIQNNIGNFISTNHMFRCLHDSCKWISVSCSFIYLYVHARSHRLFISHLAHVWKITGISFSLNVLSTWRYEIKLIGKYILLHLFDDTYSSHLR